MHAQTSATHPIEPLYAKIRLLLMQAHGSLVRDPADAVRCIEGAVRLLPEGEHPSFAPKPALTLVRGGLAQWQVSRVKALVEARLSDRLSNAELAAVARLSPGHFSRAFRCSLGDTPKAYINRRRIERSKVLMLQTNESLAMIAVACGLADQAHFCRMFRRFENESPSVWRRLRGSQHIDFDQYEPQRASQ
jgi:transcriptional regulator GlxA family with amidase domain